MLISWLLALLFCPLSLASLVRRSKRQLGGYGYNSIYPYYSMYTGMGSYGLGGYGMGAGMGGLGNGLGSSAYTFPLGGFGYGSYPYSSLYSNPYMYG